MWDVVMTTASVFRPLIGFNRRSMTFLDYYVMCVLIATWEVCINTIKVLVEVILRRCLSGQEIINVNEDSSTSTRRVP